MVINSETIRRNFFWFFDFLHGSKVRKHYLDICTLLDNPYYPQLSQVQEKYLFQLLMYSTKNVPYYKNFRNFSSLHDFPVINKTVIKTNYDKFLSTKYLCEKVIDLHTSGSTGTPFVVKQDKNKRNRVYAEMIYFWEKAGYQIGYKYIFFRVWTEKNRRSRLSALARNVIMEDILFLDDENCERIRLILRNNKKIKMILGYASTLEILSHYLWKSGDNPALFNIETIISSSEALSDVARDRLKKIFGCNVVSMYSNQENGLIAQECSRNWEYHLNNASYKIELLKFDNDETAKLGEEGRIVITDLFNYAMPLIRYDTGDIGLWKEKSDCDWNTQVLASIKGRSTDYIFTTTGRKLSPHSITNFMWPFDEIKQFQFIQEERKLYRIKLNGAKEHYSDLDFVLTFKNILGNDAEIIIEHVEEIPILESGKRKKVVCIYSGDDK